MNLASFSVFYGEGALSLELTPSDPTQDAKTFDGIKLVLGSDPGRKVQHLLGLLADLCDASDGVALVADAGEGRESNNDPALDLVDEQEDRSERREIRRLERFRARLDEMPGEQREKLLRPYLKSCKGGCGSAQASTLALPAAIQAVEAVSPETGAECECAQQIASLEARLKTIEERAPSVESSGSDEPQKPPVQSSQPVANNSSIEPRLIQQVRGKRLSPLQMAADLNKNQNQAIAKHFGLSSGGAELDIVLRTWPVIFPNSDLNAALIDDFKGLSGQEIASRGTAESSRVLCQALGVEKPGSNERARAKQIHAVMVSLTHG